MTQPKPINLSHISGVTSTIAISLGIVCGLLYSAYVQFENMNKNFNRSFGNFYGKMIRDHDHDRACKSPPAARILRPRRQFDHPMADNDCTSFGPYKADLQRRIKRAWFPPQGTESKRIVVTFTTHRGGELSNLCLETSSGVATADDAALKAVENAAPFRKLPEGAGNDNDIDLQFTFDDRLLNSTHLQFFPQK